MKYIGLIILSISIYATADAQVVYKKIPDKLVVLTFDDAVLSHYTNVAPLLKKYHFGATFFVCEFVLPPFSDTTKYMTWQQIGKLNKMGFEIGNHTYHHTHVNKMNNQQLVDELTYIEQQCKNNGIKKSLVSFAYPGYDTHSSAIEVLKEKKYLFARGGWNRVYDPEKDHPYLLPSFTTLSSNKEQIIDAFSQAKNGKVVILTIHGVPDDAHPPVTTPLSIFKVYLQYLKDNNFKVIALRDLKRYINIQKALETIPPIVTKS